MDPLLAIVAELWWVAPAAAGAGAVGWVGVRGRRTAGARRLELTAAKNDVRTARDELTRGRAGVSTAQAELVRAQADRSSARGSDREVDAARRGLQNARQRAKAAAAALRARRAGVRAARATLPRVKADPADYPLAQLVAAHNAVLARWLDYETDPAKLIAFPALSDGRSPVMAVFLRAQEQAQWLRPPASDARMSPQDFGAYREAVHRLERAFDAAEHEARRQATHPGPDPRAGASGRWSDVAQDMLTRAQRAIDLSSEAVGRVSGVADAASRRFPARSPRKDAGGTAPTAPPAQPDPEYPENVRPPASPPPRGVA